jgi:hypothetical protein
MSNSGRRETVHPVPGTTLTSVDSLPKLNFLQLWCKCILSNSTYTYLFECPRPLTHDREHSMLTPLTVPWYS